VTAGRHFDARRAVRWRLFQTAAVLARISPYAVRTVAPLLGEAAALLAPGTARIVDRNLRVLVPSAGAAERRGMRHSIFRLAARYYAEILGFPGQSLGEFSDRMHVDHFEYLQCTLARGKGAIIVGIHHGPAEMVLQALATRGLHFTAMIERLQPPEANRIMLHARAAYGQTYVYPGLAGTKALIRALRRGGIVALLIDRDIVGTGSQVTFCGRSIRVPTGAVELSRATGAPIVPATCLWGKRGQLDVAFLPPVDAPTKRIDEAEVHERTGNLLRLFEDHLRQYPGQWLLLQPFFD
jgi:KDO2-lipid IV(A) lauroyltransferase